MSQLKQIAQHTDNLIGEEQLEKKLSAGKCLRVKLGVDPTRPDLTYGHLVVLNKLRQFQDLGHQAILLIGDYTSTIGDPTGRSKTRPVLSADEAAENAKTYLSQAFRILDKDKTEVRHNSEWFKEMSFTDCLNLTRKMTVARMLERDDFSKRYRSQTPISIVEFLYPLIQGYDSIMLKADVELGGSDQLFNMLVGRTLQKDEDLSEQAVVTMPLLVGLDGTKKMSKSADNYIAFNDSPKEMFGKIMSIGDETMWDYYALCLEYDDIQVEALKSNHPMAKKKDLAKLLVAKFYSQEDAQHELEQFEQVFSRNELPDDMPEFVWSTLASDSNEIAIIEILNQTKLFPSKKEIRRLIDQGAVKVNSEKVTSSAQKIQCPTNDDIVIQAGKRKFLKLRAS